MAVYKCDPCIHKFCQPGEEIPPTSQRVIDVVAEIVVGEVFIGIGLHIFIDEILAVGDPTALDRLYRAMMDEGCDETGR